VRRQNVVRTVADDGYLRVAKFDRGGPYGQHAYSKNSQPVGREFLFVCVATQLEEYDLRTMGM